MKITNIWENFKINWNALVAVPEATTDDWQRNLLKFQISSSSLWHSIAHYTALRQLLHQASSGRQLMWPHSKMVEFTIVLIENLFILTSHQQLLFHETMSLWALLALIADVTTLYERRMVGCEDRVCISWSRMRKWIKKEERERKSR